MDKYTLTISASEIMEAINKPKSTFYDWKKRRPEEFKLIKEALLKRKLEEKLRLEFCK